MDYFHHGTGIIKYDPFRPGMKNRTQGWCVANVDREICNYYRNWLRVEKHTHLHEPSYAGHISIVRGEQLDKAVQHLWKKYDSCQVEFVYEHGIYHSSLDKKHGGVFYWIKAECLLFDKIRKELKLPIGWNFHITIGRSYEYDARSPKRRQSL